MATIRLIDKGENKGMAQARGKEGAFSAPIPGIFVQQNRSGEAPNTFRSSTGEGVSVVSPKCLCSRAPYMGVVAGRIRMRNPVLKPLVRKLRGPNAGSTRYLNLFPASIGW
jgi:hypothetical protein